MSDWTNHGRDRQPRVRSCPRQSGDFAGKARRRVSSLLPTQSEAVPDHRHLRGRQSWFLSLGIDLDIRTDLPRYRVWRDGKLIEEPTDIVAHWRDDLVAFLIGCSFSFEHALMADGLTIRHIEQGCNVPMYRTNVPCAPAGPFAGPLVVSMRPFNPADAIRAIQITTRFPAVHGAPVHFGDPAQIGISDIANPDYGDAVTIRPDEVPVFWACGVTPQSIILQSRPDFAITHAPGCMLVSRPAYLGICNSVNCERTHSL